MHNNKRRNPIWIHNNSDQPTFNQINNNTTPNLKKIGDATYSSNLAWIEGNNYHAKNMNRTKFFHNNE